MYVHMWVGILMQMSNDKQANKSKMLITQVEIKVRPANEKRKAEKMAKSLGHRDCQSMWLFA